MTRHPVDPLETHEHECPELPGVCRDILTAPMALDRLLRPDFPAPGDMPEEACADAEAELDSIEAVLRQPKRISTGVSPPPPHGPEEAGGGISPASGESRSPAIAPKRSFRMRF